MDATPHDATSYSSGAFPGQGNGQDEAPCRTASGPEAHDGSLIRSEAPLVGFSSPQEVHLAATETARFGDDLVKQDGCRVAPPGVGGMAALVQTEAAGHVESDDAGEDGLFEHELVKHDLAPRRP